MSSATLAENKRIARRYPEAVATEGNVDLIEELVTEDYVEHGVFGDETRGADEDMEKMRELLAAFPDFEATVDDIVAEDDTVAMRVTLEGTHEGEFQGIEPTGNSFAVSNMVFTRIEGERIAERWVTTDMLGLMQQLGIVDVPG